MPEYNDNGRHEYYEREDLDYFHTCQSCNEDFLTTKPVPPEDARTCSECYVYAVDVIQRWWREYLYYKRSHCVECNVQSECGYFIYRLGSHRLCNICFHEIYEN